MRKILMRKLPLGVIFLLLAACGQSGPLYLPPVDGDNAGEETRGAAEAE